MKHIKKIKIDIDKKNLETISSVQYDSNTRFLHINLVNNSLPLDLTGCSVKISAIKTDNTAIFNNCTIINAKKGFVEVELTEQMNAAPGTLKCELKLYSGSGVLTTKHFDINITASVTSKEVISSNEFKALTDALNKVNNIDDKFENLTKEATEKATKEEIQKQIEQGNMAGLAIKDKSLDSSKIKDKSLDFSLLDEDIQNKTREPQEYGKDIPHIDAFVTAVGQIQQIEGYSYKKYSVKEGETIYITANCKGSTGALAVFLNKNNGFVSNYKVVADVGGKYYVDEPVIAPANCAYVLIHTRNKEVYPIVVKKETQVVFSYKEFLYFKTRVDQALNSINEPYDELLFDNHQLEERVKGYEKLLEFDWKNFDKGYVVIIIDDGRHDLCKFLEIFKKFNMPLSCALMTSNLNSIQDDGRKLIDVALDIQANGGEVLSHSTSGAVFTETTSEEDANERLRSSKKILTEKGLKINGFVKPGGTGALSRLDKFEHLMRKYYRYGYSAGYSTAYSPFRYDMRGSFETMKARVDNAIKNKSKVIFYSHSFDNDEVTEANLRALLTYIKDTPGVELVTTKYLYDNFATNTIEKRLLALENK